MRSFLRQPISIAPLVVFRMLLGAVLLLLVSRTLLYGWVDKFYVQPSFFFHFVGFDWVQPLGRMGMYALFITLWFCALGILLGFFYRIATFIFLLGFVYTELLDVTHYLNHYYLVSLLCGLMLFLPAHRAYSLDAWRKPRLHLEEVPRWTVFVLQLQLGIVYFYAGVAKLEWDWLGEAQPLRIWLARHSDLPLVGGLLSQLWVAYAMSWAGAFYDLSIPFWLAWQRSRRWAYLAVVGFHTLTWSLFPIGIFPFLMVGATTIFFSPRAHQRFLTLFIYPLILILSKFNSKFAPSKELIDNQPLASKNSLLAAFFGVHFALQILLPLRHWCYPGDVLWNEEGFRFAWKVMLIEKRGQAMFRVRDAATGRESLVNNLDYLTEKQEFMMSTQPDFILQFAHFLRDEYREQKGYTQPQVFADVRVALNGRPSRPLVRTDLDLATVAETWGHQDWVILYK